MDAQGYLVVSAALLGLATLSGLLGRVGLTPPILCLAAGFALDRSGLLPSGAGDGLLRIVAEATLAVVLFGDAARTRFTALRRSAVWTGRVLLIGGPLSVVLGTAVFALMLDGWDVLAVAVLAALLVPTDAVLSQRLFSNDGVPDTVRETLTAESGLNDGLALPSVIFLACAAVGFEHALRQESWLVFAMDQIGYGTLTGLATGALGALLLSPILGRGSAPGTAALALVPVAYFAATASGGNGFVGVFVAGLTLSAAMARLVPDRPEARDRVHDFVERDGQLLTMVAFLFIGAAMLPDAVARFEPAWGLVVAASLLVVRPVAVWIALAGSGADWRIRLAMGWFGPRGLATALFAVFVLREFMALGQGQDILAIATLAVAASAVLHGLTAPAAALLCGPGAAPSSAA
jgi:NhaP-type Na+/H+ or K+/H+ antiporter